MTARDHLPALTDEQRRAAYERAVAAREERAAVKAALKAGDLRLADVLARDDPTVARMRVAELLRSLPGVGSARAARVMDRLGIARNRRVRGLGPRQREALLEWWYGPGGSEERRPGGSEGGAR